MDARFRFFKSGNGTLHVWPPVGFANKPQWGGATQVVFENGTTDRIDFVDTDGALTGTPGQSYSVPPSSTTRFDIAGSVVPGNAYVFTITHRTTAYQDTTEKLAYFAANPEIIIVG